MVLSPDDPGLQSEWEHLDTDQGKTLTRERH